MLQFQVSCANDTLAAIITLRVYTASIKEWWRTALQTVGRQTSAWMYLWGSYKTASTQLKLGGCHHNCYCKKCCTNKPQTFFLLVTCWNTIFWAVAVWRSRSRQISNYWGNSSQVLIQCLIMFIWDNVGDITLAEKQPNIWYDVISLKNMQCITLFSLQVRALASYKRNHGIIIIILSSSITIDLFDRLITWVYSTFLFNGLVKLCFECFMSD